MHDVNDRTVSKVIELSRLLGEYGQIKRVPKLPNGELESDSHHSFVLALTAAELAQEFAPDLDLTKILLYCLVHDLPEMITGDMVTLTASTAELAAKAQRDEQALEPILTKFAAYPLITQALRDYEASADQESLFVYWLDKMITIPTHFFDQGANLRDLGIGNRADIKAWYERTLEKLRRRSATPPPAAPQVLELAYQRMRDELL